MHYVNITKIPNVQIVVDFIFAYKTPYENLQHTKISRYMVQYILVELSSM